MKKISLITAQVDCGSGKHGANLAPDKLLQLGLVQQLNTLSEVCAQYVVSQGNGGKTLPNLHNWEQISNVNRQIFDNVTQSLNNGQFPLLIGGDHSVTTGSVLAVNQAYNGVGVIWIDAHGDWNNQDTTPSGNLHGMSFSASCGYGPDCMSSYATQFVNPVNGVVIGARDLDEQEAIRLRKSGVTVFTPQDVKNLGAQQVALLALDIATSHTNGVYVSLDIDAVSPQYAPGTGTPVDNGLTPNEVKTLLDTLAVGGKVVALDAVEINPTLDKDDTTSKLALQLITSAIDKM